MMKKVEVESFCPTLTAHGQAMLDFLREHPAAPIYRNQSGNRLLEEEIDLLRAFDNKVQVAPVGWARGGLPDWMLNFLAKTYADVPHFRRMGLVPSRFEDIPTVGRADLAADIAQFVPDSAPLERMINFRTTGTTGHPMLIASHPLVAGSYLAFHKRALRRFGIELKSGRGEVGVVLLGMQKKCFTYVSVTPVMNESGLAKINLHPDEWRILEDRERYLNALNPEIIAGDPISFNELLTLSLTVKPRALISVSMTLTAGLRARLEGRFACPVLDVYSMNEVGPIGVFDSSLGGHLLLQPDLYVEILDPSGNRLADGVHGEITFTGGFNFCLPLVRYRSGDFASLSWSSQGPVLKNLSGRQAVQFKTQEGKWINNIDVTHALNSLPLPQFGLHQNSDATVVLRLTSGGAPLAGAATALLRPIFGDKAISLEIITVDDKFIQYSSDLKQTAA